MAAVRLGANRGVQTVSPLVRVRTGDAAQDAARADLERDQREATSSPLLGGVLVDIVIPDVGALLEVHHRLGRKPQGYFPVRVLDSIFDMHEVDAATNGADPKLTLVLERGFYAAVDSRFTLWIF